MGMFYQACSKKLNVWDLKQKSKANNVMVTECEKHYLIMANVIMAIIIFEKGAMDVAGLQKS